MQRKPNEGSPVRLPDPDSLEYRAQKAVLLHLVVVPPEAGEPIDDLAARLSIDAGPAAAAIDPLEVSGLAGRHGKVVQVSAAALHFENLWPVMLS